MLKFIFGAVLIASTIVSPVMDRAEATKANVKKAASFVGGVGILDVNRILTESKASKSLNSQMEIYRKTYQDDIHKREQALRQKETNLVADQKNLSPNEFEKKKKDFEKQVTELQKFVLAKDAALKQAGQVALDEIRKAVIEITRQIAQEKGFGMILPSSIPIYIANFEQVDITEGVLGRLDNKLPKIDVVVKADKK